MCGQCRKLGGNSFMPHSKRVKQNNFESGIAQEETISIDMNKPHYIVIGGGIAAVSCAEELSRLLDDSADIFLVSGSTLLKKVVECELPTFRQSHPLIKVIDGKADLLDIKNQILHLEDGRTIPYSEVCVCTGAVPRLVSDHPNVIGIRDLESVVDISRRLQSCRTIGLVGNGGIALEMISALDFCTIKWIVRDSYIGSTFFDASASQFLMPTLASRVEVVSTNSTALATNLAAANIKAKLLQSTTCASSPSFASTAASTNLKKLTICGAALGPDWATKADLQGKLSQDVKTTKGRVEMHLTSPWFAPSQIYFNQEVAQVLSNNPLGTSSSNGDGDAYPVYLTTTAGEVIGCDFVISAIGVTADPCLTFLGEPSSTSGAAKFRRNPMDGSLLVNEYMETSVPHVYAAGDCCTYSPTNSTSSSSKQNGGSNNSYENHWFQMRLWTQAHQQGLYVAHCMCERTIGDPDMYNMFFELFAHTSEFLGQKVILLGRFNGQGFDRILSDHDQIAVTADMPGSDSVQFPLENCMKTFLLPHQSNLIESKSDVELPEKTSKIAMSNMVEVNKSHDIEIWLRVTPEVEYIKLVVFKGRVVGALLIGDTDMEEVVENLILNQLDVSMYGIDILDPHNEVEDYFD